MATCFCGTKSGMLTKCSEVLVHISVNRHMVTSPLTLFIRRQLLIISSKVSNMMKDHRVIRTWRWKLHIGVCLLFPVLFMIVLYYESTHLQAVDQLSEVYFKKTARVRHMLHTVNGNISTIIRPSEALASDEVVKGRRTMILIANYRDSKR